MKKIILLLICMVMICGCNSTQDNYSSKETKEKNNSQEKIENQGEHEMKNIVLVIHDEMFQIELENNETAKAFVERLPMTLSMNELNHNEKYCYLDETLPTNEQSVGHIQSGDVMLFGDNCLVVFYESFSTSYQYTRIGKIADNSRLKDVLGKGKVDITFQLKSKIFSYRNRRKIKFIPGKVFCLLFNF